MFVVSAEKNFNRGLEALADQNYVEAIMHFRRAMDIEHQRRILQPDMRYLSYYWLCRAKAHYKIEGGLHACKRAAQVRNQDPEMHLNLGRVYLSHGPTETPGLPGFPDRSRYRTRPRGPQPRIFPAGEATPAQRPAGPPQRVLREGPVRLVAPGQSRSFSLVVLPLGGLKKRAVLRRLKGSQRLVGSAGFGTSDPLRVKHEPQTGGLQSPRKLSLNCRERLYKTTPDTSDQG